MKVAMKVLVSKPLPWESGKVTHFKQVHDDAALQEKSPLAKRQMKLRRRGMHSSRPRPRSEYSSWVFAGHMTSKAVESNIGLWWLHFVDPY